MADEEKGLSAAVDTASESEETESSSEEEEESFEEYESGADEAGGEPAAVKTDAVQVIQSIRPLRYSDCTLFSSENIGACASTLQGVGLIYRIFGYGYMHTIL